MLNFGLIGFDSHELKDSFRNGNVEIA